MSDHSNRVAIAERLKSSTRKLHALAIQVGQAKQIREFASDRRKNLLAKYVAKALKDGQSATAAETIGRANEAFQAEFEEQAKQFEAAEVVVASWMAEQASHDAARSLLSYERETIRNLDAA